MKHTLYFFAASTLLQTACQIKTRIEEIAPPVSFEEKNIALGSSISGVIEAVGAASNEFVPETPTALAGFGGLARRFLPPVFAPGGNVSFCRPYENVANPPKIKVAVFDVRKDLSNQKRLFLISLDVVAVTADLTAKIHRTIDEVVGKGTADLNSTIVVASHTHSGPAGLTENPLWGIFVCDQYSARLTNSYLNTLKLTLQRALASVAPITKIETTTAKIPTLVKSRFEGMEPINDISLLAFRKANGDSPLALLQMAVHPTKYGPRDLVLTADLVAPLEKNIKEKNNSDFVFLLQTEIGNMDSNTEGGDIESWARNVAEQLKSTGSLSTSTERSVSTSANYVSLPSKRMNWESCDAKFAEGIVSLPILENLPNRAPYSAWMINEELSLFLPGEWTTSGAQQLKNRITNRFSIEKKIKIFSLANEYTAYHLSKDFYAKKNLESCSSLYGEGNVDTVAEGIINSDLLR